MLTTIRYAARGKKDLQKIAKSDPQTGRRIVTALTRFAEEGIGDVKKLQGTDQYRLRVGDWRVVFEESLDESGSRKLRIIDVIRVKHRREVYR